MKPALDWNDPAACRAWLADLRGRVGDLRDAAEDQTAPMAKRKLGRAEAVRLLSEAGGSLDDLLSYAARGLPRGEPH